MSCFFDFYNLAMFVLATVGMTHIIVDGSILQGFRDLVKSISQLIKVPKLGGIVDCYLCAGTWCGFFMGFIWMDPPYNTSILHVFACGCAGGFLSNLAAVILNWIEAATIVNLPDQND